MTDSLAAPDRLAVTNTLTTMQSIHCESLVNGQFVGADSADARLVSVTAPFDGAPLGTSVEAGWPTMDRALDAATRAFQPFSRSPRPERQALLQRIATSVRVRAEELALLMAAEVGKPIGWARAEVTRLAVTFDLAAELLDAPAREELSLERDARGGDYRCFVERVAMGPLLAIVPYNWPYNLTAHKLAPALAAGNSVVLKPSPQAMLSTLTLAGLVHAAGAPAGVVNAVCCGPEVAERAACDPRIAMVSFTGSERVGWHIKGLVPNKPVVLELGGDASVLVFADAELAHAAERACLGGYGYAGQVCIAVQHVRAHEQIYEVLRDKLVLKTLATPWGDPLLPSTVCGPLISSAAAERVMAWIEEAKLGGAKVLAGGRREGNVVVPTLLEDVPDDCKLAQEEVFGPVLTLSRFPSMKAAFDAVNRSRFGIHCGVFTRDEAVIEAAFAELEVGGVVVNEFPTMRFDVMPYGGVKRSGVGREGLRYAHDEMTLPKVLLARR
ncbi:MAG: aldehyde dehydrogenase family protein [Myxococcales bacterium]|nr:aldehyde dehydrogenase family protein [Myxococcales bacterium]